MLGTHLVLQNAGAHIIEAADPCLMPKAAKNETEIAGMKACHIRDGVAMAKFLSWIDAEVAQSNLHNEAVLADKVQSFREQDPTLMDLSFDTISAAGGNAAMCHYNHENQPEPGQLETEYSLPSRFRRPVFRWYNRHHSYYRNWSAKRRNDSTVHSRR